MGKGRTLQHAMKSKITPFGRWCPKPNARARCMGAQLFNKTGGGRVGVRERFMQASSQCGVRGS